MYKICIFLLFIGPYSYGQNSINQIINKDRTSIIKLDTEQLENCILIPSEFAKELVNKSTLASKLKDLTIVKAYYVYTKYKLNSQFNQKELDRSRFQKLKHQFPGLIAPAYFEWELLEQTGCKNFIEGSSYFHGFILVHRPLNNTINSLEEFNRVSNFFANPEEGMETFILDPVNHQIKSSSSSKSNPVHNEKANFKNSDFELYQYLKKHLGNSEEVSLRRYDKWVDVNFNIDKYGDVDSILFPNEKPLFVKELIKETLNKMPAWNPEIKNGKDTISTINMSIRVSYSNTVKGMYKKDGQRPSFSDQKENPNFTHPASLEKEQTNYFDPASTSTYKMLNSYLKKNRKLSLVMDVTGSMAPYIAAITSWVFSNHSEHPFTSFTFFNDGDDKPTHKKKIGTTKGVYYSSAENNIRAAIKNAMVNGNGGERPENDIEAVLKAQEEDEETEEILLLGDNWSEVRDLKLIPKINKVVNVLLCGDNSIPRNDYIKIAYDTGGDLIYNNKVYDLRDVSEKENLILGEYHYKYNGKDFVRLK